MTSPLRIGLATLLLYAAFAPRQKFLLASSCCQISCCQTCPAGAADLYIPGDRVATSAAGSGAEARVRSAGCRGMPSGALVPNSAAFSGAVVEGLSGVQIGPGSTVFISCVLPAVS